MLTPREKEIIRKELSAFNENFSQGIFIERQQRRFYIFQDMPNWVDHNWIYSADSIQEVKGWLYGAVQAKNGIVK